MKYKIVVDKYETPSEQRREYEFECETLGSLGEIHDEIEFKSGILKIIKKIENNGTGKYQISSTPRIFTPEIKCVKNPVAGLENKVVLFKSINYLTVETLKGDIYIRYIADNVLNDALVTTSKLSAELTIRDGEISQKVSKDNVVSSINLTPEEIKINADKIKLEGVTTINNGFSVDLEGNMSCNNASINGDLVTAQGVYTMLNFDCNFKSTEEYRGLPNYNGYTYAGYDLFGDSDNKVYRIPLEIDYIIPDGFTVDYAFVEISNHSVMYEDFETGAEIIQGNLRDFEIWENTGLPTYLTRVVLRPTGGWSGQGTPTSRIDGAFNGENSYSFNGTAKIRTSNIKDGLDVSGSVYVRPIAESYTTNASGTFASYSTVALSKTALVRVNLVVLGWYKKPI